MKMDKKIIEALGEYYIDINVEKNKNVYLNVINKFINLLPSFKPPKIDGVNKFSSYLIKNNLMALDSFYFMKNPSYQINSGDNHFCLCVDENNIKHILVCRGRYATPKELDNKLSLTTIINFYLAFVGNVIYPTKIIRDLKEINLGVKNFKYPRNVLMKRGSNTNVYIVNEVKYNKKNKTLTYKCKSIGFGSDGTLLNNSLDRENTYTLCNIDDILNFLNVENSINDAELNDFIMQSFEKKIQSINNMMTKVLSKLNNF